MDVPDDFGSQLRRARTRKGLDVNTVARRLRIRPDIIQAIEESDFDRMLRQIEEAEKEHN